MLRAFNNHRTLGDNIRLGTLTAFSAGMINVASLVILFSFTSNVTGTYAILASEIAKGNPYQIAVVLCWILAFFGGGFLANLIVIHWSKNHTYRAHAVPVVVEMLAVLAVGFYGGFFYRETLGETEVLTAILLLATGLQNGLTASITNFSLKTTHVTGITTDLAILAAMFTKAEFRHNPELRNKAKLLSSVVAAYFAGALAAGFLAVKLDFAVFYIVAGFLFFVATYDFYRVWRAQGGLRLSGWLKPQHAHTSLSQGDSVNAKL
ncbi:MAG: DUF1275 domain-containing protein [Turneriella sp.]|nr:DUF1275 domain-containing protein [Turneriella sp.]